MRPRLLDLFCGAGGAGEGYRRAGFDVVGVDITEQPENPGRVIVADAMEVLAARWFLDDFDAIHASPPCQASTTMSAKHRGTGSAADDHIDLIPDVIGALTDWGGLWVVENVTGARAVMPDAITVSGGSFGLSVERPRLFASSVQLHEPEYAKVTNPIGVYGRAPDGRWLWRRTDGTTQYAAASVREAQAAMGIDWMSWRTIAEAIPPAYTEFIGKQLLLSHVRQRWTGVML